ncbi:MAG: carboxypeptidase regulatory-like domain-containing protein [Nitrospirae bacterium]|nr:carboxypeptidase regulatory-like domain-containing protein [Nitrospirota bacterium]
MKKSFVYMIVLLIFMPVTLFASANYEVIDVENGGSIKGTIKASSPADDPILTINKDKGFCGNSQPSKMYVISAGMGVKNVLVAIEDIDRGKALPKGDLVIDNIGCRFEPLVGIAYIGHKYIITNSDPIFHNVSINLMLNEGKRRTLYNVALPDKDMSIEKPVITAGMGIVRCDAHRWMRAFVYATQNPYAAVTDASGNFEIKDVPPGKYKVKIWHEGFGETSKEVEVKSGRVTELYHTFSKK